MIAPHSGDGTKVPVTTDVVQWQSGGRLQAGRPFLPAGSGRGWVWTGEWPFLTCWPQIGSYVTLYLC